MPELNTERRKRRRTLSLSDQATNVGVVLAEMENRSFSNFVETLIDREAKRLGLKGSRDGTEARARAEEVAP